METPEQARQRAVEILAAPLNVTDLAGGAVRVEKGGIVGVGDTLREAIADWSRKCAVSITRPAWPERAGEG